METALLKLMGADVEEDYLARAFVHIERAIRRRWAEGHLTLDPDGVFTSVLGAEHVEKLLAARRSRVVTDETPLADHTYDADTPLGQFVARHHLTPSEADVMAVLLAVETDPAAARLIGYLGGNQQSLHTLSFDLLLDLVYRSRTPHRRTAAALMHADLAPHSLARRLRFMVVEGSDTKSTLAQTVRLHPRVTAWLLGDKGFDADLSPCAQLLPAEIPVGERDEAQLTAAVAAFRAGRRLILVEGAPRSGRALLLRFAAAELQQPLLLTNGRELSPELLVAAFREAVLHDAVLVIQNVEDLVSGEGRLAVLRACLEVYDGTVAMIGSGSIAALAELRPVTSLRVEVPPHTERLRLWRQHLAELPAEDQVEVAAVYNLGVAGIVSASQGAREMATLAHRSVSRGDVSMSVRQLFDADLTTVATRQEVSQGWEDIVLPDDLGESIVSIIDRIRHRSQVLGDWGFARKVGKGLGVTALFSGEPGTGKSMVASLVARELGLHLYVVDLARVTSKWLGETEKNLGRAFDAAEAGHVLLLFDEADSILGKRSEVRSSNDRHANLETNFILARLEQFQGIAVFTTNLASAIDPAVSRRMSAHVNFPFPDVEMRAELWRRMVPREMPIKGELNFRALATRFELSGGFIRNIVLRAAYAAAQQGGGLTQAHLERAAASEYSDRGSLVMGGRLV